MPSAEPSKIKYKYVLTLVLVLVAVKAAVVAFALCFILTGGLWSLVVSLCEMADCTTVILLALALGQLAVIIRLWVDVAEIHRKLEKADREGRHCNQT